MAKSRYPSITRLLSSATSFASRSAPQGDDDDDDDLEVQQPTAQQQRIKPGASIDQEALFEAMDTETAAAASSATQAANKRWKEAFDAEECRANPAATSRLLATTNMSASDVIETVKDLGVPSASGKQQNQQEQEQGLERLSRGNRGVAPLTGSGANADGGGADTKELVRSRHKATVEKRNAQTQAQIERNRQRA